MANRPRIFVAKRFDQRDEELNGYIEEILRLFGLEVITGEPIQQGLISNKVRRRISDSDLFAGIITKGIPEPSPWVIEELTFARLHNKRHLLFVEEGVVLGGLYGDDEYVRFERESLPKLALRAVQYIRSVLDGSGPEFPSGVKNLTSAGQSVVGLLKGLETAIISGLDSNRGPSNEATSVAVAGFLEAQRRPESRSQILDLIERDIRFLLSSSTPSHFLDLLLYVDFFPLLRNWCLSMLAMKGATTIDNKTGSVDSPLHLVVYGHSRAVLAVIRRLAIARRLANDALRVCIIRSDLMIGTSEHEEMARALAVVPGVPPAQFVDLHNLKSLEIRPREYNVFLVGCERIALDGRVLHPTGIRALLARAQEHSAPLFVVGESYKVCQFESDAFPVGLREDMSHYPLDVLGPSAGTSYDIITDHSVHHISTGELVALQCCEQHWTAMILALLGRSA